MKYEQLVKGDTIYYIIVNKENLDSFLNSGESMQTAKVVDVVHKKHYYFIKNDKLPDLQLTLEEYFENSGDIAYSDEAVLILGTTVDIFKEQLNIFVKNIFSEQFYDQYNDDRDNP